MKILYLAFASMFISNVSPMQSYAKPININGLDWSMSDADMRKVLERDGYVCDDLLKETHDFHCKKDGTIKKPTKQMGLRTLFDMYGYQLIIFSCDVFGLCQQNMREIGQLIVDGGILSQMYIDRLTWPDFSGYSPKQKEILVICGDGDEGDKLCVNEDGDLILLKGRYGSENPFGKGN